MALTAASYKPLERMKQLRKTVTDPKESRRMSGATFHGVPSIKVENGHSSSKLLGDSDGPIRQLTQQRSKGILKSVLDSTAQQATGKRNDLSKTDDAEKRHVSFGGGMVDPGIATAGGKRRESGADFGKGKRRQSGVDFGTSQMTNKKRMSIFGQISNIPAFRGSVQEYSTAPKRPDPNRALDLMSLKYRNQTMGEKAGQKWLKNPDETKHFLGLQRRRSTINLYSNVEVMDVLSTIQAQQKKREQERVKGQLDIIKKRVKRTLDSVGMDFESDEEEDDGLCAKPVKISMFDTRAEREKMRERNYIIGKVDEFEEKAVLKRQYLTELCFWFEENLNMCHDVVTPDEMKDLMRNSQELHMIISKSLEAFIKNANIVVDKGKLLLDETSRIIAERKAQMEKKMKKERIIVYDDKMLIKDPIKWELAANTIISVFEDSQKMIRNVMFKNALKLSQRQFEYMIVASEKKYQELDEKKKHCVELQGKLHSAKMQSDRIHRETEEQRRKMDKVVNELNETKQSVEKLQARNKELNQEIGERNGKIKLLEESLREKLRTPTPPPTPPPPPEPEKVIVKVVDSATELRLQEVEEELEETKEQLKKLEDELRLVTEKLLSEKDTIKSLQEKVTELEDIPTPEPIIIAAPATPIIQTPPDSNDKDSAYYRTLMTGMKNDYEVELEKVKTHIQKEKARGEAALRKTELQHKDQLNNIQKDIIRMLRGILHFRDHLMVCMEKESLFDQSQALFDLGDLIKDKLSPNPKELLANLVSTVIDYLHNMEGILYNSFKAMRILMRYQIEKQVDTEVEARMSKFKQEMEAKKVQKEVQKKAKALHGARKDVTHLAKRLKKTKNKLRRYQKDLENVPVDKKYKDLLQRYNHVILLYKNMCKEMEMLQSDFHDTMVKKLEEKETMVITQIRMEMKQQRAITEEQLKISIKDKKENLLLLSRAYEENKISKDLYSMASTMLRKAMDIPRLKLQNLFEQYITFRTVQESKVRVKQVLYEEDSELVIDTRREMELYLDQMDEKFTASMMNWRIKMKQLDFERRELNKRIYTIFNEVLLETGVLLIHPLLKDSNKRNIMAQAAGSVTRNKMKQLLYKQRKKFKAFRDMPDMIQGCSVVIQPTNQPMWNTSQRRRPPSEPTPGVMTPHLLAYNVNKPRILAARQLKKPQLKMRRDTISLKKTESFNINESKVIHHLHDCLKGHTEYPMFTVLEPIKHALH